MDSLPTDSSLPISPEEASELLSSLLHKEGSWVEWGHICQKLQKSGYISQKIFEETGFQASQQNLVIVASQVYDSIVKGGVSEEVKSYFLGPRSDILYEFRILNQEERAAAAELTFEKKLDIETAREAAKAIKEFNRFSQPPADFSYHPGDAVAYQYWKKAKQKKELQDRARLIAQGLKFAHSQKAREAIEKLLQDFTVIPPRSAPLIPIYRLELEEELPRIIPVVGTLPLTKEDLAAVSPLEIQEPFRLIKSPNNTSLVPIPGWQIVLKAADPLVIFAMSNKLPKPLPGKPELVLLVVDRQITEWDINSYFLVEQEENLEFQWFEESPNLTILGKLILVLRPKNIVDENNITESWQMDD